ncbi:MAG: C4-dicarboxylate TRAP transporter large permease protein DctM [Thermoleophilia bacterium]
MSEFLEVLPAVVILFVLLFAGIPIYLSILVAALYLSYFVVQIPLEGMFVGLYEALTKPSLLAVPLFLLAGSFLGETPAGERLIDIFSALFRRFKAGLPLTSLFANAFFGAISGSAPAAVATFSKVVHEPLKARFGERLSIGLITSSGGLSTIIPPSITLIIYGVVTDTSITDLFLGGVGPGLVLVALVGAYLILRARQVEDFEDAGVGHRLKEHGILSTVAVVLFPVVVLGGIYAGYFTPTEAGAVAAIYAALMGLGHLNLRGFLAALAGASRVTGQIFIVIAASAVLAQAMTLARIPQLIADGFAGMSAWQFLLMLNVVLLIVGAFFDPASAILVLAPLFLPSARALGLDPIHIGVVFTVNLSIGMFTPPFGLNIFVAQSVLKRPMEVISRSVAPYVGLYLIGLLLVTYLPWIATWLPAAVRG